MDQLRRKDKSVGILCDNSSHTVSQLKCLTASIVSRRMDASELITFISLFILRVRFVIIDLDILGEFTTLDAIET